MDNLSKPEDLCSVIDIQSNKKENYKKLIDKIREDIEKHKQGVIEDLPTYLCYLQEFKIPSRKKVKELILDKLSLKEIEYINTFWKNKIKKEYSRAGWIEKEKVGDYAEEIVKKELEAEGWEVLKISPYINKEKRGWLRFNWEELEKRDKAICKKLYQLRRWKGCYLPDFVCFKGDLIKFVEVKAGEKVKWKKQQIKGIEKLEELGYEVEILKPVFFENEINDLLGKKQV